MLKGTKLFLVSSTFLITACHTTKKEELTIDFSADRSKIILSHIEEAGLKHLKDNLSSDSNYQKLVAVLQTPTENDSTGMEMEWPGKLTMSGEKLVFTPDTPFKKGKSYLVETIINSKFATIKEIMSAKVGHKVKLVQKTLIR